MKKISMCLVALLLLTMANCQKSEFGDSTTSDIMRYGLKEGYIKYKITGGMGGMVEISGEEELCFKGPKEVRIQNQKTKTMGMTQVTHTATYTDFSEGGTIYNVDLSTDPPTGTMMVNPVIKSLKGEDLKEFGRKTMEAMGGKITEKGKVLDKECDIWEMSKMGTKTWVWKWITLKSETNMMGMKVTNEAVEISEKCDKDLNKPNIEYKKMSEKMEGMEGMGNMMNPFQPE